MIALDRRESGRRGITLTEILIAIMILGVGLVSLATLFPIGLLRLRDAARSTRTKYLVDSAAADGTTRSPYPLNPDGSGGGLLNPTSFARVDALNYYYNYNPWYMTAGANAAPYNPLVQDTPGYDQDYIQGTAPNQMIVGASALALGAYFYPSPPNPAPPPSGYGLPFAYDPLWRYQTVDQNTGINGYYLNDTAGGATTFEARFGSGLGFIRLDPSDGGLPSAHGLQRITNFNRPVIMPGAAVAVPSIFVSQEDVVWVEALQSNTFSSVLPDLDPKFAQNKLSGYSAPAIDWKYTWMFTGYQVSSSGGATFEGSIVIFENRPFGISAEPNPPNTAKLGGGTYRVAGETVVEAIFGHSGNIQGSYGAGADRTVLLRWYSSEADPIIKPGDWICDVTYERNAQTVYDPNSASGRFATGTPPVSPYPNLFNNSEWDNLPAQRCFWYQVQKVLPALDDPYTAGQNLVPPLRSMVVYVDRTLQARTVLSNPGTPLVFNAALICPYVVNVIPQQFTVK